jgi:SPP1 gp7 family putative phage head morphogenesis protein
MDHRISINDGGFPLMSERSLLSRLTSAFRNESVLATPDHTVKTLIERDPIRLLTPETKANSISLLPRGAYGDAYQFFSSDSGRTMIDLSQLSSTAMAFAAYWYVAIRWRAQKIAEAPLMVVKEDQETGDDEWLPDHELVPVLDMPSPDFDMGTLLERTSRYLDNTGECIWVKDYDRGQRVARLFPFHRNEFTVHGSDTRLYQTFTVATRDGSKDYDAEQVCFFRDAVDDGWRYSAGLSGYSRLDVAMNWLRLGESARQTIRDLLDNAVWPSAVVIPDKEWNPDPDTLKAYKAALEGYGRTGQKGKPFVQLGGGSFTQITAKIRDLVPEEVLNRVESIISAVTGVPAIVLQFQIGMENSPWSQMAQARRMAYDDTVIPSWAKIERTLTHQLLRPIDDDPTHFMRFDTTDIASLQMDQLAQVQIATLMGKAASLNERRAIMGLEPVPKAKDPDGRADDIPELTQPDLATLLAGTKPASTDASTPPGDNAGDPKPDATQKTKLQRLYERKMKPLALTHALQQEAIGTWDAHALMMLYADRDAIVEIVSTYLLEPPAEGKSIAVKARGRERAMTAVTNYLKTDSKRAWSKALMPLATTGAERATAISAADLGVNYSTLHPSALKFARTRIDESLSSIGKTTRKLVNDILQGGIEEGRSVREIADVIRDATGFTDTRSMLIARTETTAIYSGAPVSAISAFGEATGRSFLKTWFGVMDDRERDEHVALEGETVGIDENFSNGLQYPSEPNCRCAAVTHEAEEG